MFEPKMLTALHPFEKREVTPKAFVAEFGANYKDRGIFPTCLHCGEDVFTYGTSSTQVLSRFKHYNGRSCQTNAIGFGKTHPGFDFGQGEIIKEEFCEPFNIKKAYSLCLSIVGRGNFPVSKFIELSKKANKKNIWSYVGVEVWMIPYMLLTLDDFTLSTRSGDRTYDIRFVFDKSFDFKNRENQCDIEKIFSDSQRLIKSFPVNEDDFDSIDIDWIPESLVDKLIACCN